MSKKKKLPHYSRIFPAPFQLFRSLLRWIVLLAVVYINIQAAQTSLHTTKPILGQEKASPPFSYNVLGASDTSSLELEYTYWKQIISQKPEYRDGLIQSSVLAYKLNRLDEAEVYAHKAYLLDPNNHTAQSLLGFLKSKK